MKIVVQRVKEASVAVEGKIVGEISQGLLLLIGVDENDTQEDANWLIKKVVDLRIFSDNEGKKNMGLKERRKKIMALMLAACVAGTSTVPVTASDISVFSDGTNAEPEVFDSSDVATAADTNNTDCI